MCMITRCWSFWCLHFSFTEKHHKKGGKKPGSYMSTTLLHLFTPQRQEDRPGSRSRRANNWWTAWPPHTWQVCGIGRGNHSVGLGWALCFHLGQWCRRGNFQPQPDSLSARWKTSTSWKWKQLWGRPIREPRARRSAVTSSTAMATYATLFPPAQTWEKYLCDESEQNIWTLKSNTLCPITRSDNPIIDQL